MDYENMIEAQLDQLDLSQLSDVSASFSDIYGIERIVDLKAFVIDLLTGNEEWNGADLISQILRIVFNQIDQSLSACAMILLIALFSGLLNGMITSFGKETASEVGMKICVFLTITITLREFINIYEYCIDKMDLMVLTVQSLFPVLIPISIASGAAISGSILQPMLISMITGISTMTSQWLLPAVFYSCTFCLAGRISSQSVLLQLGKFIRNTIVFGLGLAVTVLSAFTTIQGSAGKTADSLIMKSARYSIDHLIPLIGGFAADSMELVTQCTIAIKNAIGLWGVVILLFMMLVPLIKLTVISLIYKLCSVLAEALDINQISGCLEDTASAVTTLAVLYLLIGILFIVFLSVIIHVI